MIMAIVWLLIICGVAAVALWAVRELTPPEPIGRVVRVVIIVITLLAIIGVVAGFFGINTGLPTMTRS